MDQETASAGVKVAHLVAGFFGGSVYLVVSEPMPKTRMLFSIGSGVVCAGYLTPLAAEWLQLENARLESSAAFLIGLVSMVVIPGLLAFLARVAKDPIGTFRRYRVIEKQAKSEEEES